MPKLASTVAIKPTDEPKFPNRCIVCGKSDPDDIYPLTCRFIESRASVLIGTKENLEIHVPVCAGRCCFKLELDHKIKNWLYWGSGALAVSMLYFFPDLEELEFIGFGVLFVLPTIIWETLFHHHYIFLQSRKKSYEFAFRSPEYAAEFAELNDDIFVEADIVGL